MLTEIDSAKWGGAINPAGRKLFLATDVATIGKIADSAWDRARALQFTAGRARQLGHDPLATRRNASNDGWLILVA